MGGKAPADDTSDDEEDTKIAKPQRRRGLCIGKAPADSDDQSEAKKKKVTNNKTRCCLCQHGMGRRNAIPALDFDQWRHWLSKLGLLPEGFAQDTIPPPAPPSGTFSGTLQRPRGNSIPTLQMARSNSIRGIEDGDMSD